MKRIYAKTTKLIIGALITTFFLTNVHGQTVYQTVADGNWNNVAIWTPAYPGTIIAGIDTVYIEHDVTLNTSITSLAGTMNITAAGSLTNLTSNDISSLAGTLNNWGTLAIYRIRNISGTLNNYSTVDVRDLVEAIAGGIINNENLGDFTTRHFYLDGSTVINDGNIFVTDPANFPGGIMLYNCAQLTNNDFLHTANDLRIQDACSRLTNNGRINIEDDLYSDGIIDGVNGLINICDTDGGELQNRFENREDANLSGQYICMCADNPDNVVLLDGFEDPGVVIDFACGGPLPVEYSYVEAQADDIRRIVKILWETANEVNNNFFTIERSVNGDLYEAIGTVNGSGNSTSLNSYSFVDDHPIQGVAYYRIMQTDLNGEFSFSKVVSAELIMVSNIVSVYPNPVKGSYLNVNIALEAKQDIDYMISNITGQVVQSGLVTYSGFNSTIELNELVPGMYYVTFNVANELSTISIIIQ